jgi:cold shock CspA family protein
VTELDRGTGRHGVVTAFDEAAGLGTITDANGVDHPFHCIEIADGSRSIEVGTEVSFDVLAKFGRWEAANVRR